MLVGLFGSLLLVLMTQAAARDKQSSEANALEIVSTDPGEFPLELSWRWGGMAVNHVVFNDHRGPYKAIVEPGAKGVKVTFDGWGKESFTATANKQVRITSRVAGKKEVDFTAEAVSPIEVRVRPTDRAVVKGKRIVIGLGSRDQTPTILVEARG